MKSNSKMIEMNSVPSWRRLVALFMYTVVFSTAANAYGQGAGSSDQPKEPGGTKSKEVGVDKCCGLIANKLIYERNIEDEFILTDKSEHSIRLVRTRDETTGEWTWDGSYRGTEYLWDGANWVLVQPEPNTGELSQSVPGDVLPNDLQDLLSWSSTSIFGDIRYTVECTVDPGSTCESQSFTQIERDVDVNTGAEISKNISRFSLKIETEEDDNACCGGNGGGGGESGNDSGGCSDCDGTSGGSDNANLKSLDHSINLGRWNETETAGALKIQADEWDASLSSRASLDLWLTDGLTSSAISDVSDPNYGGDRISTNFAQVDMMDLNGANPLAGYKVEFFRKDGMNVQSNPFARFVVTSPASQTLRVERETIDEGNGNVTRKEASEYAYDSNFGTADRTWTLTQYGDDGNANATVVLSTARVSETNLTQYGNGSVQDYEQVREYLENGQVARSELRTYRDLDDDSDEVEEKIVEWVLDNTSATSWGKRTWVYYEKQDIAVLLGYVDVAAAETAGEILVDDPRFGKILSYVSETGYWEHYTYDKYGRLTQTIQQLSGEEYDPTDLSALASSNLVFTAEHMDGLELTRTGYLAANVVKTQVAESGTIRRTAYELNWSLPYQERDSNGVVLIDHGLATDFMETWTVNCVVEDPLAGGAYGSDDKVFLDAVVADGNFLGHDVERVYRFDPWYTDSTGSNEPYLLAKVEHVDGTVTLYDRPDADTQVVTRGYPNAAASDDTFNRANDSVVHGTRTTRVYGDQGQVTSTLVERVDPNVASGAWVVASLVKTTDNDIFGRATQESYYFGVEADAENTSAGTGIAAYTTSQTYGCCGADSRTDRYGQVTTYTYDDLRRMSSMTRPDGVTLHYSYDSAGRTSKVEREASGGGTQTVDGESGYDLAGRMTSQKDAGSKFAFYTYRKLNADGTVYDPATDTGPFYAETRVYPHNASAGPVRVTWTDSHGRAVLSLSGSVATNWSGAAPGSIEDLSAVYSRVETEYDWAGRVTESRSYHDFGSLALADLRIPATPGSAQADTHYYVVPGGVYDAEGRMVRSKDVLGNITVTVYDDDGRAVETWVGTDDGNPTDPADYHDPDSLSGNLVQVGGTKYDSYGEMEFSLALKPGLTTLGTFAPTTTGVPGPSGLPGSGDDATAMNYDDDYTASGGVITERESWSKPADNLSPWTKRVYDARGRMIDSVTYQNGSTTYVLARSTNVYAPDTINGSETHAGRMTASRVHEVNGSGGLTGNYLETTYAYDSVGRQFKSGSPGGGYSLTLYDSVGRVEKSLVVADDNGTDTHTDDVVATETVYFYDEADNVIFTESYGRRHDTSGSSLGLLSDNPSWADVRYAATWYDDAHRPRRVEDFGDVQPTPAP